MKGRKSYIVKEGKKILSNLENELKGSYESSSDDFLQY